MKITIRLEKEHILFICKGKFQKDFFSFKQEVFTQTRQAQVQNLLFTFDAFPLDLNILGFLLSLTKTYTIQVIVSNYSSFRMLESLYLIEKLNVEYQKEK